MGKHTRRVALAVMGQLKITEADMQATNVGLVDHSVNRLWIRRGEEVAMFCRRFNSTTLGQIIVGGKYRPLGQDFSTNRVYINDVTHRLDGYTSGRSLLCLAAAIVIVAEIANMILETLGSEAKLRP